MNRGFPVRHFALSILRVLAPPPPVERRTRNVHVARVMRCRIFGLPRQRLGKLTLRFFTFIWGRILFSLTEQWCQKINVVLYIYL